jgi:hypothetical protein
VSDQLIILDTETTSDVNDGLNVCRLSDSEVGRNWLARFHHISWVDAMLSTGVHSPLVTDAG